MTRHLLVVQQFVLYDTLLKINYFKVCYNEILFPLKKTLGKTKQALRGWGHKIPLEKNHNFSLVTYVHITEKGTFHFSI